MTTIKITAAAFIASLAIGATAQAAPIKPVATGNAKQDRYCKGVAELVNDAYENAGSSTGSESSEWYDLGQEFQARAEANGCTFKAAIKRKPARGAKARAAR